MKKSKNTKRAGERSEAAFLHKASSLGFGVAKPWGDSERYDFILETDIACSAFKSRLPTVSAPRLTKRAPLTPSAKDAPSIPRATLIFLVAHIVPLDIWYVLPVEACMPAPMLRFYPHRKAKQMRLEKYREAWELMKP
jgi:hypothetical protein